MSAAPPTVAAAAESQAVVLSRAGRVATLTLDRPPLNVLDLAAIAQLDAALAGLEGDADLQVLVLRGAGPKAFSAGVAIQDHTRDKIGRALAGLHGAVHRLRGLEVVTVAAVHGHCLGGGLELALACDLIVAADNARFGQPEIELGCFPPVAAALYPSLLGERVTLDLVLTGRILGSEEAERLGIVSRRAATLDEALDPLLAQLTAKSAAVTRLAKRAVRRTGSQPLATGLAEAERIYLEELTRTEDMDEGLAAFQEKRKPSWQHR
ncbi:MAG TPA: enoyl-CoA hydratase/isomerase family protein [Thermoanaerobaculia bacterium]|nr:enoyl-CoA hydratase/isomerase family protein [Thermoanaerobaculia bacterium]